MGVWLLDQSIATAYRYMILYKPSREPQLNSFDHGTLMHALGKLSTLTVSVITYDRNTCMLWKFSEKFPRTYTKAYEPCRMEVW